jgi:hypothetical protein
MCELSILNVKMKSHAAETFFPDLLAYLGRKLVENKTLWLFSSENFF